MPHESHGIGAADESIRPLSEYFLRWAGKYSTPRRVLLPGKSPKEAPRGFLSERATGTAVAACGLAKAISLTWR